MWLCSHNRIHGYTLHELIFLAKCSCKLVVASMAGVPLITETESSESEADETENSGNATGGEMPGLPQKRKKYSCSYRKEYNKRFPWVTDSKKGPSYAFCMPCGRNISLAQGGTKDLRKYEQTTVHTKLSPSRHFRNQTSTFLFWSCKEWGGNSGRGWVWVLSEGASSCFFTCWPLQSTVLFMFPDSIYNCQRFQVWANKGHSNSVCHWLSTTKCTASRTPHP